MHHRDRRVGIAGMDDNGRRPVQVAPLVEPFGYRVARIGIVGVLISFVMLRPQVVIEKRIP